MSQSTYPARQTVETAIDSVAHLLTWADIASLINKLTGLHQEDGEWIEHVDSGSGSSYWERRVSREATWTNPRSMCYPHEWDEHLDDASGKKFWHNRTHRTNSWDDPKAHMPGWAQRVDEESKAAYWHHEGTGETSWDLLEVQIKREEERKAAAEEELHKLKTEALERKKVEEELKEKERQRVEEAKARLKKSQARQLEAMKAADINSGKPIKDNDNLTCDSSLHTLLVDPSVTAKIKAEADAKGDLIPEVFINGEPVSNETVNITAVVKAAGEAFKTLITAKNPSNPNAKVSFGEMAVEVRINDEVVSSAKINLKPDNSLLLPDKLCFVNGINGQQLGSENKTVVITFDEEKLEVKNVGSELEIPKKVWTKTDGPVSILVECDGYRQKTLNFHKYDNVKRQGADVKVALDPNAKKGEEFDHRFILTWGMKPSDLDIHAMRSDGEHIYFSKKNSEARNGKRVSMALDVDEQNGKGPETMTISTRKGMEYVFYVYNYSKDAPMTKSEGVVHHTDMRFTEPKQYTVPKEMGADKRHYWWICKIYGDGGVVDLQQLETKPPSVENGKISVD
ncbi:hypothetical protein TrVE_jg8375 [Triparma verrucosa]|uniref:WW domain-containing protein n=1 Tax=Triparma verrucosa TaxID=1606542 RepID=A0A9W7CJY6_9STRA|nr:hypothetical protein TrVE_jg8375 [Triparma verrucosa]